MRDTLLYPPSPGNRYLAVTIGGCFAQVEWKSGDEKFFICAMPYPKIPPESRKRMNEQYPITWDENLKDEKNGEKTT